LHQQGNYREAEKLYRAAEEAYRALGEHAMALRSRHMRSLVVRAQGRLVEAEHLCETTITETQELGLGRWLAHPLYVRGLLARDRSNLHVARESVQRSLELLGGTDELAMIAQCHHFLGELGLLESDLVGAREQLEYSLHLSQRIGILRRVAATQRLLGDLAQIEGRYEQAERIYDEALEVITRLDDRPQLARLLLSKAQLVARLGRDREASDSLKGAMFTYGEVGDARGVAGASLLLARLHISHRRIWQAVKMTVGAFRAARSAGLLCPHTLIGAIQRWHVERI